MMSRSELADIDLRDVYFPVSKLPESFEIAVIPVDKPRTWSSFDVIRHLRRVLNVRKMGHAGTLDPLATGLLIILIGRATKLMERFMELPKVYEGTMRLGEVTPTYDAEGEVTERRDVSGITREDLLRAREQFIGTIQQEAPAYSAIKVDGERLYKKARRGEKVRLPIRVVTIDAFELLDRDGRDVSFRVACSKGTYIRSLAHEYGQALGVGAHLVALRRTAIGAFTVDEAWTPAQLEEAVA
ncbi:MAG: tRNA pseudouridine(55) synthase TruB [Rhodothermales bacterium]